MPTVIVVVIVVAPTFVDYTTFAYCDSAKKKLGLSKINYPSNEETGGKGGELVSNGGALVHNEIRILGDCGIRIVAGVILTVFNVCGVRRQRHCDVEGLPLTGIDGYNLG